MLVENFKVGSLAKLGLGYEQLREEFPRLVYCSVTGFGQTGPYAKRAGYDFLAQGMGGIMSITGTPGVEPVKVGVGITDVMTGMYASTSILAALRHRDRTGEGQHVDCCLLDTQVAWLINEGTNYLVSGKVPQPLGNAHPNIVPYQVFATADGHVILACGNDGQFQRWCDIAGAADLKDDPRFATNPLRIVNRDALTPLIAEYIATRTTDQWVAQLEAGNVPCGPVNTIDRVFEDPQVQARGMKVDLPHPLAGQGTVPLIANPVKLSGTPIHYRHAPPTLGQHTDEVLAEVLGMSADEIAAEKAKGAI